MRNFVYIIGSTDDFSSQEELLTWYKGPATDTHPNGSVYPVSLSEGTRAEGYKGLSDIATMIGRGEAMSDGWCLDDTLSILLEE